MTTEDTSMVAVALFPPLPNTTLSIKGWTESFILLSLTFICVIISVTLKIKKGGFPFPSSQCFYCVPMFSINMFSRLSPRLAYTGKKSVVHYTLCFRKGDLQKVVCCVCIWAFIEHILRNSQKHC